MEKSRDMNLVYFSRKAIRQMLSVFASLVMMLSLFLGLYSAPAIAGDEPYIGEITTVPYEFCPRNWAEANGRTLPINQYSALFALLGTTFGGDGINTFGLPDLRGRVPLGVGNGPGLTSHQMGERAGQETVSLKIANGAIATNTAGSSSLNVVSSVAPANISTIPPYTTVRYCIATQGIFPSRP